jgi:hypothetical protein
MLVLKFRPSSHSEDGTVVAEFPDRKAATKAVAKFGGSRFGNKMGVTFDNGEYGTMDEAADKLEIAGALGVKQYYSYQELTVTITVPTGSTLGSLAVVIGAELATILKELTRLCKEPTTTVKGNTKTLIFKYAGESIFSKGSNYFYFGWRVKLCPCIQVQVHRCL